MHDRRRALLAAAVGFVPLPVRRDQADVGLLRRWLDTWTGIGAIAAGMARQGYDLQLTRYGAGMARQLLSCRRRAFGGQRKRVATDAASGEPPAGLTSAPRRPTVALSHPSAGRR